MELHGLQLVMLGSVDIPRSLRFYRDTLQLPLLHETDGFAFFQAGDVKIVLTRDLGERIAHGATFASELVFGVDSVRGAYEELREKSVAFVNEPRVVNADAWAATCSDPDGHLISFYGKP